jgi:hypothetical protein
MTVEIPAERFHLLRDPNFGMLGTIRPDNTVQVNPMWVDYDQPSNTLRFTHTTYRAKYRNLQRNPSMSLAIFDDNWLDYLEVRGKLTRVAGLVLEAVRLKLPLGSVCEIEQRGGGAVEAEVVGFAGDRLFLMPFADIHGVSPGALVCMAPLALRARCC